MFIILYLAGCIIVVVFALKIRQIFTKHDPIKIFYKRLCCSNRKADLISFMARTVIFSVFFALLLFYGYLLILYTISSVITATLFIVLLFLIGTFLISLLKRLTILSESKVKWLKTLLFSIVIIWSYSEVTLRFLGANMSYNERNGFYYSSGFKENPIVNPEDTFLYINEKYRCYYQNRKEFSFVNKCNGEGLRDIDHPVSKPKNEYRIICIGNSFTEGAGAAQDSTWPKMLEKKFENSSKKNVVVFNAGKSGSDPFFEFMLLKKRLLKYKPDIVILSLGYSDFGFYRLRGGFERFSSRGLEFRKGPWWEFFYAVSYNFRCFINNVLLFRDFMSPTEYKTDSIRAENDIYSCISEFQGLALKHNFNLVVFFIDDGDEDKYKNIKIKLKKESTIPFIDQREYFDVIEKISKAKHKTLYWSRDGHCNSKGYQMFANGVFWGLTKIGVPDSINNNNPTIFR